MHRGVVIDDYEPSLHIPRGAFGHRTPASMRVVSQLRGRVSTRSLPIMMFNGSGDEALRARAIGARGEPRAHFRAR